MSQHNEDRNAEMSWVFSILTHWGVLKCPCFLASTLGKFFHSYLSNSKFQAKKKQKTKKQTFDGS